jgi:hypothetical protein
MEFSSFELKDKDSKGDNLIETAEYFDESEMKKRKCIRIVIMNLRKTPMQNLLNANSILLIVVMVIMVMLV